MYVSWELGPCLNPYWITRALPHIWQCSIYTVELIWLLLFIPSSNMRPHQFLFLSLNRGDGYHEDFKSNVNLPLCNRQNICCTASATENHQLFDFQYQSNSDWGDSQLQPPFLFFSHHSLLEWFLFLTLPLILLSYQWLRADLHLLFPHLFYKIILLLFSSSLSSV